MTVKVPALTRVSSEKDLINTVNRMIEAMIPLVGQHSDKGNEAVRWADLVDGNIAVKQDGGDFAVELPSGESFPAATAIVNFRCFASFNYVTSTWDPLNTKAVAYVEIWRAPKTVKNAQNVEVNSTLADAVFRGVSTSTMYSDTVLPGDKYRYWARGINRKGSPGPWTNTDGIAVDVPEDPAYILDKISGSIRESDLYAELGAKIDGSAQGVQSLVTLTSKSWSLRVDTGDAVSGFGLMTENGTSRFLVRADQFAIAPPQAYDSGGKPIVNTGAFPFVVDMSTPSNPRTLIKNAYIDTAYITALVTGSLIADKIVGQTISGTHLRGGDIYIGSNFGVDGSGNMTASNANVSGNITASTLTATGSVSVGAVSGAGVYMTKDRVDVRDAGGVVRCRLGLL